MGGFQGFADVVKNVRKKLEKTNSSFETDSFSVDINFEEPISEQINDAL